MRWSKYFIPTLREVPQEAEIPSHKLMLRAGFISKLSSGLYNYLPLGVRVLEKVKNIIRKELEAKDAIELMMPVLQPDTIWKESGRYPLMKDVMLKTFDRNKNEFILGPTHEEIITDLVRKKISSYKQIPVNFFQIQNKFRDEVRPRFGLMRAKEFIMKDGYSFDLTDEGLNESYNKMYDAYTNIFKACGLKAKPVEADTGMMGGSKSHEFMALSEYGEDAIIECKECSYAANAELAVRALPQNQSNEVLKDMETVDTPNQKTIAELSEFFANDARNFIKTILYTADEKTIFALVRGDLDINEVKLARTLGVTQIELATDEVIQKVTNAPVGFAGPVGINDYRVVADISVKGMINAITGANEADKHLVNVNIERDYKVEGFYDIATAKEGDLCLNCGAVLTQCRGIEIGQVFELGQKYCKSLGASVLDQNGKDKILTMGCYGIGVSRTAQAVVEQNHDENGIIWPIAVAPFEVVVLPLNTNVPELMEAAEKIYSDLKEAGIDVIIDDRNERAGVKFKDVDLVGIPVRVFLGKKTFAEGVGEVSLRRTQEKDPVVLDEIVETVKALVQKERSKS